jgi:hypothetical protein
MKKKLIRSWNTKEFILPHIDYAQDHLYFLLISGYLKMHPVLYWAGNIIRNPIYSV